MNELSASGRSSASGRRLQRTHSEIVAMSRLPVTVGRSRPFGLVDQLEPSGFEYDSHGMVGLVYGVKRSEEAYAVVMTRPRDSRDLPHLKDDLLLKQVNAARVGSAEKERLSQLLLSRMRSPEETSAPDGHDVTLIVDDQPVISTMFIDGAWRAYRFEHSQSIGTILTRGWHPTPMAVRRLDDLSPFEAARRRKLEEAWRRGPGGSPDS